MIRFDRVSLRYPDAAQDALADLDVTIPAGEFCLVVGPTGSGKSTLLGTATGHVPHFTGGRLRGRVLLGGNPARDTREHPPRELADVVGSIGQNPVDGFVTDAVEDELAFVMESLAIEASVMRRRVEETLDLLGLADLRTRSLRELSSGQQQRVAIGAALTAHPAILVLDEPTSALDPGAAEEVLGALHRLVHDLGVTVLLSEHRLERVVQYADSVLSLSGPGQPVVFGPPDEVLAHSAVAPPVVSLGRLAGWSPLPVSVRDARRRAPDLLARLPEGGPRPEVGASDEPPATAPALIAKGVTVRYRGGAPVLRAVDLDLDAGSIAAIMGRNGAGKSTLLWTLQGGLRPGRGSVRINGQAPHELKPGLRRGLISLVPQEPTDLLYLDTVEAECRQADLESGAEAGATWRMCRDLVPGIEPETDPRDLSVGQQLCLVLAIQLAGRPTVILLDEPTRGLDYTAKDRLSEILSGLARAGSAVLLSSHDVEFVAATAHRVILLADGDIIADGPTADVVLSSPTYAPQVAKVLAPQPWLTVAQVATALSAADAEVRR